MSDRSLLDLPLPGEKPERRPPSEPPSEPPSPPPRPPLGPRRWLVAALVLLLAAVIGYFLPRPGPAVLDVSPQVVDFPAERVGVTGPLVEVEVQNRGSGELAVSEVSLVGPGAQEVALLLDECTEAEIDTGESCTVGIAFAPRVPGDRSATLVVAGSAVNSPLRVALRGTALAPRLEPDPPEIEFPARVVGDRAPETTVRLENEGTASLAVQRIGVEGAASADFQITADGCSGAEIGPGEECRLRLGFVPGAVGERRARLAIASDAAGDPRPVELRGRGVEPRPLLAVSESVIEFESLRVGGDERQAQALTVENAGRGRLFLEEVRVEDASGSWSVADACAEEALAEEESCTLEVVFAPAREGELSGRLVVVSSSIEGDAVVELRGRGVRARLAALPRRLEYGRVPLGAGGLEQELVVRNQGSAAATFGRVAVEPPEAFRLVADGCSRLVLGPGEECRMTIVFQPAREARFQGALVFPRREDGTVLRVPLSGAGAQGEVEFSVTQVGFGDVAVGESRQEALTLTNVGSAPLVIEDVSLEGMRDYRVALDGCSARGRLEPGAFCTVAVELAPSSAGRVVASLVVRHDGAGSPSVLPLVGDGVLPARPTLAAAPGEVHFGAVAVGARSGITTVRLENRGAGRLALGEIRLGGRSPEAFRLVAGSCAGAPYLAPGGDCTVGVRFQPTAAGEREARLLVDHGAAAEPLGVRLAGTAPAPE